MTNQKTFRISINLGLMMFMQYLLFAVWGVGLFIGVIFNGWLIDVFSTKQNGVLVCDWQSIFAITTLFSIVTLLLFGVFFREKGTLTQSNNK